MSCETKKKKNLGVVRCKDLPDMPLCMITTPPNAVIPQATLDDPEALEIFIQGKLLADEADRWYLWPLFKGFEDQSEESVYEDTPLADLKVRDGKYRFRHFFKENMCMHKAMGTHSGSGDRVIYMDISNNLWLSVDEDGDGRGFQSSLINREKLRLSDGSVSTKTPLYVVFGNPAEQDDFGAVIDGAFVNNLIRLTDVTLTVQAGATSGIIKLTVQTTCDKINVTGLLVADFVVTNGAGASIVVSTATYADGVYTLTQAGNLFVDGFVNLRAASLLTVPGYESTGKVAVDVA